MRTRKRMAGIDLGGTQVRIVWADRVRGRARLRACAHAPVPERPSPQGRPVSTVLRTLWSDRGTNQWQALVNVPGNAVVVGRVPLPKMSKERIERFMALEVQRLAVMALNRVVYDYSLFQDSKESGRSAILGLTQRDVAERQQRSVVEAGVDLWTSQGDPLALANLLLYQRDLAGEKTDEGDLLLHVGASSSILLLVKGGQLLYARTIASGGEAFTRSLMTSLNVGWEEAEKQKKLGVTSSKKAAGQALERIAKDLLLQVRSTLSHCERELGQEMPKLRRICLTGGGAGLPTLRELVAEELALPASLLDPFSCFEISDADDLPQTLEERAPFAIAAGLALEGLGKAPIVLDLSPVKRREVKRERTRKILLGVSGLLACSLVGLGFAFGYKTTDRLQRKIAEEGERLERIELLSKRISALQKTVQETEDQAQLVLNKAERGRRFLELFADVSQGLPEDLWLARVRSWDAETQERSSAKRGKTPSGSPVPVLPEDARLDSVVIYGFCESPKAFNLMEEFIQKLEERPSIAAATLLPLGSEPLDNRIGKGDLPFRIRLDLSGEEG